MHARENSLDPLNSLKYCLYSIKCSRGGPFQWLVKAAAACRQQQQLHAAEEGSSTNQGACKLQPVFRYDMHWDENYDGIQNPNAVLNPTKHAPGRSKSNTVERRESK
jgi:hypothetical protein